MYTQPYAHVPTGEDFDVAILNMLINEFKKESGIDLSSDRLAMQRLREVGAVLTWVVKCRGWVPAGC